jgi:hypothetical protein
MFGLHSEKPTRFQPSVWFESEREGGTATETGISQKIATWK